jgi:imidazolonepropionase-like amidohydrolase
MATVVHLTGPILVGPDEVRDQAWVIGDRLTFERPTGAHEVTTLAGHVVPGLVDAHCHVGLGPHGEVPREVAEQQALTDRDHGTLLIRDAGQPGDTRWVDDREDLPRIIRAGRHIARPRRYIRNYAWEVEPEDLVAQVRVEARAGDGWVKLVGDWIDREVGDLAPCWPVDVLTEAIAAAHEEGARVTAHCFEEESLHDFAEAGTDCIEHATGLTEATIATFAAQQISIVPTLVNIDTFPSIAAGAGRFPTYAAHMLDLHARRHATIAAAREAGIPIYVGTDGGGRIAHGLVVDEMHELLACGFSNAEALDAGSWAARRWLGRPALEEGADADLLVLAGDPRDDLGVLRIPIAIVLRGRTI